MIVYNLRANWSDAATNFGISYGRIVRHFKRVNLVLTRIGKFGEMEGSNLNSSLLRWEKRLPADLRDLGSESKCRQNRLCLSPFQDR